MARVTIEDCIEKVPNRFHLVQMAAIRAKQLKQGANTLVEGDGNKAVVISLREIAAGLIQPDYPDEEEVQGESLAAPTALAEPGETPVE
jgi:DNA-directed RNA polymerase subunit omega